MNGILIKNFEVTADDVTFDMVDFSKGIYLYKLESKTKVITGKVIF